MGNNDDENVVDVSATEGESSVAPSESVGATESSSVVVIDSQQYESLISEIHSINVSVSAVFVCLLFSLLVKFFSRFFGR